MEVNKSASINNDLLFHLEDIDCISQSYPFISTSHHMMIFFIDGCGTLTINDSPYLVTKGKIFLIKPQSMIDLSDLTKEFRFYKIAFTAFQLKQGALSLYLGPIFSEEVEYTLYPNTRFIRLTEDLPNLDYLKQQGALYELLNLLFEHQLHMNYQLTMTKAVGETINYIYSYYQQPLTVKKLAELAHIAQWQYSTIFQTLTGKKPLDYITDLRLTKAKELLLQTNEPLKDIAQRVGFEDEYYFNRRFRQVVGIPPKQFARQSKQKTVVKDWTGHEVAIPASPHRIIYHGETFGDMLIFDVQPIGGDKNSISKSFYKNHVPYIQDVAFPINLEKSSKLNPDLIIFTNNDEQQYQALSSIAPTITLNSWDSLEERVLLLGRWLSQQQRAEDWLEHFKTQEKTMWQQLQTVVEPGESASVLTFDHGKRLFIMGCTGLSTALFHPDGFQPHPQVKKLLQAGEGYREIPIDHLPQYAGDRIFMLLSDKPESQMATIELINSDIWKGLPAVQTNHAYLVDATKWNYGDAFTREKLLGALPKLLVTAR
ncbi:helix-turn-helix domain-containing protein [Lysinibacillus sp. FSL H8-0500]|uniref:helix-turn-helix domain-containing protein n=1 Tax=Lysinibacillus sp. FSL H8-0500 TaxID=2921393 RepID=UPI00310173DE